eukprot:2652519-Amphidinium_carterae.1
MPCITLKLTELPVGIKDVDTTVDVAIGDVTRRTPPVKHVTHTHTHVVSHSFVSGEWNFPIVM